MLTTKKLLAKIPMGFIHDVFKILQRTVKYNIDRY